MQSCGQPWSGASREGAFIPPGHGEGAPTRVSGMEPDRIWPAKVLPRQPLQGRGDRVACTGRVLIQLDHQILTTGQKVTRLLKASAMLLNC